MATVRFPGCEPNGSRARLLRPCGVHAVGEKQRETASPGARAEDAAATLPESGDGVLVCKRETAHLNVGAAATAIDTPDTRRGLAQITIPQSTYRVRGGRDKACILPAQSVAQTLSSHPSPR